LGHRKLNKKKHFNPETAEQAAKLSVQAARGGFQKANKAKANKKGSFLTRSQRTVE